MHALKEAMQDDSGTLFPDYLDDSFLSFLVFSPTDSRPLGFFAFPLNSGGMAVLFIPPQLRGRGCAVWVFSPCTAARKLSPCWDNIWLLLFLFLLSSHCPILPVVQCLNKNVANVCHCVLGILIWFLLLQK